MAENPTHPSSRYCGNYQTLGPGVRLESYTCPSRAELFETEYGSMIIGGAMLGRITIDTRNAIKRLLDYKDVNPDFIVDSKIVDLATETIKNCTILSRRTEKCSHRPLLKYLEKLRCLR